MLAVWLLSDSFQHFYFYLYLAFSWIVISLVTKFYQVYRFTKLIQIAQKILAQFFLFSLNLLAFNGLFSFSQNYKALARSEEHTSELQSRPHLVCRLLFEKKKGLAGVRGRVLDAVPGRVGALAEVHLPAVRRGGEHADVGPGAEYLLLAACDNYRGHPRTL